MRPAMVLPLLSYNMALLTVSHPMTLGVTAHDAPPRRRTAAVGFDVLSFWANFYFRLALYRDGPLAIAARLGVPWRELEEPDTSAPAS